MLYLGLFNTPFLCLTTFRPCQPNETTMYKTQFCNDSGFPEIVANHYTFGIRGLSNNPLYAMHCIATLNLCLTSVTQPWVYLSRFKGELSGNSEELNLNIL
jgi:hypothetical protein